MSIYAEWVIESMCEAYVIDCVLWQSKLELKMIWLYVYVTKWGVYFIEYDLSQFKFASNLGFVCHRSLSDC